MEITLRIPDELARRLGPAGEIERRALEALALEEYRLGHLSRAELRRLLGFATDEALDQFLRDHGVDGLRRPAVRKRAAADKAARDEARRAKARQAAANIIARRVGVTLGGLKIKDLINEGRK